MFATSRNHVNFDKISAMFKMDDVSPKTQIHLKNVYGNLAGCTAVCALGMYINAYTILSGMFVQFAFLIGMAYLVSKVSNVYEDEKTRLGYLWALAFSMGFLVGPLMHHLAEFEPSILINAVFCTTIIFGSFTAMALFTKRRSMLFLGGIISSLVSCLFWYRTISWLFGYSRYGMGHMSQVYLMASLFMTCLYVCYDTQMIIERAERGDKDIPSHTMTLFMDLFDLFIKIIQILIKLSEDDKKKKNKRRD